MNESPTRKNTYIKILKTNFAVFNFFFGTPGIYILPLRMIQDTLEVYWEPRLSETNAMILRS